MRKIIFVALSVVMLMMANGCKERKATPVIDASDSTEVDNDNDSTIYGVCGEGTTMHNLQLVTDAGDTLQVFIDDENPDIVQGGLLSGDRIALIGSKAEDGSVLAQHVINLTSLLGKWTSLDKNFDILEGGEVQSHVKAENNPWTSWKIVNGKLVMGRDTFMVDKLGPDSLYLENKVGIFVFKRQE